MPDPKHIDFSQFDFSFDPDLEELGDDEEYTSMDDVPNADPGVFLPNTEGRSEFLPPDPERVPKIDQALKQDTPEYAARPAEERTRELFHYMKPHRAVLLGVLDAAREPIPNTEMVEIVDELRQHKFSVYDPSNICTMLETAGAIERVTSDGAPYAERKAEPDIVVIDGVEYYEPTYPEPVCWKTSEAGMAMLDEDDPVQMLREQLDREPELAFLYKRVLNMCAQEGGVKMPALSAAVDKEPIISKPRRRYFVQHFVEELERCEAVIWSGGAWVVTDAGRQALDELLGSVEDDFTPDETITENATVSTETQGVNW